MFLVCSRLRKFISKDKIMMSISIEAEQLRLDEVVYSHYRCIYFRSTAKFHSQAFIYTVPQINNNYIHST